MTLFSQSSYYLLYAHIYFFQKKKKRGGVEVGEEGFQKSNRFSKGFSIIISTMSGFLYSL